jgi:FtsP/CotA-like multicopper oxidase with cupredoxin domain
MAFLTRRQAIIGAGVLGAAAAGGAIYTAWPRGPRLVAGRRTLDVGGKAATVLGLEQRGWPERLVQGERFKVTLQNHLDEPTLIHWHGLTPPSAQDGTPGLSQPPLVPGGSYDYDFPLKRAGTYWMHSHQGLQRAKLLAAPLIVAEPGWSKRDEQEVVLFLTDFSFREPEELLAGLTRGQTATHDMAGMDHAAMNHMDHMDHGAMDQMMEHAAGPDDPPTGPPIHANDIEFDAYLANDRSFADPEIVRVEPKSRVRLRIINGAAATNFWIVVDGSLQSQLIAVDGNPLVPRAGRRFALALGQRIDLSLTIPDAEWSFAVIAVREGAVQRTGIILATPKAEVAKVSPAQRLPSPRLDIALEGLLEAAEPLAERNADRTFNVDLTGDMASFVWGINGKPYGEDTPLMVREGERIEMVLQNRTNMSHPMHLHGHRFQIMAIGDRRAPGAMRDTMLVPVGSSVTIAFDADNPGKWAFHCHNEYHMAAGMMTSVQYEA